QKVGIATEIIEAMKSDWALSESDIIIDPLTFPITTGQEETRNDAVETLRAISELRSQYPELHLMLGVSNVSFGIKPVPRKVLNSVFLNEAVSAGLDIAIINPANVLELSAITPDQVLAARKLIFNDWADGDPLTNYLALFPEVPPVAKPGTSDPLLSEKATAVLADVEDQSPGERLAQGIITGSNLEIAQDIDSALQEGISAAGILNEHLLPAMAEIGRRFGAGEMQLPFVLQSAATMQHAINYLQPFLTAASASENRGVVLLATVAGDVHDIGKNLVNIIFTNNGYQVIDLGIKQSIDSIIDAAVQHDADVIGLSGLLVKSVEVMGANLKELTDRGFAHRWPVLVGGAALNQKYVTDHLQAGFPGIVRYAKDAFTGLEQLPELVKQARTWKANRETIARTAGHQADLEATSQIEGANFRAWPALLAPDAPAGRPPGEETDYQTLKLAHDHCQVPRLTGRSERVGNHSRPPAPPFWGHRILTSAEIPWTEVVALLDRKAIITARWGLRGNDRTHIGEPRLNWWLEQIASEGWFDPAIAYGYWPARSGGNVVVVETPKNPAKESTRWEFPRQTRAPYDCLADWVSGVLPIQLVSAGAASKTAIEQLSAIGDYRGMLELNGVFAGLTEALAEWNHRRIIAEWLPDAGILPGARFSFGYPSAPNLEYRKDLFRLVNAQQIGVVLTADFLSVPEFSTDALIITNPAAHHFTP
ncbi:MAG: B12-binding domain-containing protein, partial [Promicromonosporaceae bacterium]|nr:B12-binding domain-containing protein [Promicromonosporaceae bacterium]